jgi:hypothetical protein
MSPDLIDRYALLDPAKHADALSDWSIMTPPRLQSIDEQSGSLDVQDVRIVASKPEPRRNGPLAAAVAFGVVLVVGITLAFTTGGADAVLVATGELPTTTVFDIQQAGPIPCAVHNLSSCIATRSDGRRDLNAKLDRRPRERR